MPSSRCSKKSVDPARALGAKPLRPRDTSRPGCGRAGGGRGWFREQGGWSAGSWRVSCARFSLSIPNRPAGVSYTCADRANTLPEDTHLERKRIGEILVDLKALEPTDIERVLQAMRRRGGQG